MKVGILFVLLLALPFAGMAEDSCRSAGFGIPTDYGFLEGRARICPEGPDRLQPYSGTIRLEGDPDVVEVDVLNRGRYWMFEVRYGTLGQLIFHVNTETGGLVVDPRSGIDCNAAADAAVTRAMRQVLLEMLLDAEFSRNREVVPALLVALDAPLLAGECEYSPFTGWCSDFTQDYSGCKLCCQSAKGILGSACAAASGLAGGFWGALGAGIGYHLCERPLHYMVESCIAGECTGKPGDPECDQDSSCEDNGGTCKWECSLKDDAGCGRCIQGSEYKCCVEE